MARQFSPRERTPEHRPTTDSGPVRMPSSARSGNQAKQEELGISSSGSAGPDEAWINELLAAAPVAELASSGRWSGVQERARRLRNSSSANSSANSQDGTSRLMRRLNKLDAALDSGQVDGVREAAKALADEARSLIDAGRGDSAQLQEVISGAGEIWTRARDQQGKQLGITEQGMQDMSRLASAASRPWYSAPRGKCYRAVAGFDSSSYMNRAGGRWKQLADRIPGSHGMWAVSFAHWLQETAHGQRAARELGFEIRESDGRTRLGDYLAKRPELKGSIGVIPHGQEGTASSEWKAAANYGDAKWRTAVADISVVSNISARGATYVADAKIPHDNATMWWVVYPK